MTVKDRITNCLLVSTKGRKDLFFFQLSYFYATRFSGRLGWSKYFVFYRNTHEFSSVFFFLFFFFLFIYFISLPFLLLFHHLTQNSRIILYFANSPGDLGSILGRVIPKTLKMVLHNSLLNTQQNKVRIKGKVEQSWEKSSALPWSPSTTVANLV